MPTFKYTAKKGPTQIIDGSIEAENLNVAVSKITQLGLSPIKVNESIGGSPTQKHIIPSSSVGFLRKIKLQQVVLFTQQLSDLVDASVPLLRALNLVGKQTNHLPLKEIIENMKGFVADGGSFSDALKQYSEVFPPLYINMVKTGEVGGQLPVVLRRLAGYLESEYETRRKIVSSLTYPILIFIIGFISIFVLMTFVIPRITIMFEDINQELPFITLALVNMSDFFARFWWAIIGGTVGLCVLLKQTVNTPRGKLWMDTTKLKLPLLGDFMRNVEIARFARTLGTLLDNGVVITKALNSLAGNIDNLILKSKVREISEQVANGSSINRAIAKADFFPDMVVNIVAVGEETGNLSESFTKVADLFEKQSDVTAKTMVSLIGPLVLIFIISVVGLVVIAMLLPIFQMNLLIE